MPANEIKPEPPSRTQVWLKRIGVAVLALGISGATLVYWLGRRSSDLKDDLSMVGYDKAATRQMGHLYGKMGPMVDDLIDDLKRPGTQATLILTTSALLAFVCFHFQRRLGTDDAAASSEMPDSGNEPT